MEIVFGLFLMAGLTYLVLSIIGVIGGAEEVDGALETTGLSAIFGLGGEVEGLGCTVIAAFLAGFGAVGLTGALAGWNLLLILGAALLFGVLVGRLVVAVLRYVYRQQGTAVFSNQDLIGLSARITIDSDAGKTGEALVESDQILKYPVKEITGAALRRGDIVEIVDIEGSALRVKKKRA